MMVAVSEITRSFPILYSLNWEIAEIPLFDNKPFQTVIVLGNKYVLDHYECQSSTFI